MINTPFSDSIETNDVDLNQLYEALTENSNYQYFDGELCAPSPTMIKLKHVIIERGDAGQSLVLDPSDGPLFMEYFAMRFRFVHDDEMAFLEWHKQHTFNSDAKAFIIVSEIPY